MSLISQRKIVRLCSYLLFLFVSVLFLLEVSYRVYLIDFYKNELNGLNTKESLENSARNPVILAMGDSFTADPNSYVQTIRNLIPQASVINSGVPGSCVREAALMTSLRIRKFRPEVLLYQIYVGNDLIEFNPPYWSKNLSFARRCYWWLSPKIQILGYINFRLRFIRQFFHAEVEAGENPKIIEHFSTENYAARTKMMFKSDPRDLENCIFLKNGRERDMANYVHKFNAFLARIPDDCLVYVIVIPHCIQLNSTYRDRMIQLGAQSRYPDQLLNGDFPFLQKLTPELIRKNIHLINALPILQQGAEYGDVYYENDPHLSPSGQKLLAEHIVEIIKQNNSDLFF